MIKFVEKIFSYPVIIILEALFLAVKMVKIFTNIIDDVVTSVAIKLEIKRDKVIEDAKKKDQDDQNKDKKTN